MRRIRIMMAIMSAALIIPSTASAAITPEEYFGAAAPFAVLAMNQVAGTPATTITGDLGVNPGSLVGNPRVTGTKHIADQAAKNAQSALEAATGKLNAPACITNRNADELGNGETITVPASGQHVVCAPSSLTQVNGTLILDGGGNSNSEVIFRVGSTFRVLPGAKIVLTGGLQPCNVHWLGNSGADIADNVTFVGDIVTLRDIRVGRSTIAGRVMTRQGAIALTDTEIKPVGCSQPVQPPPPVVPPPAVEPPPPVQPQPQPIPPVVVPPVIEARVPVGHGTIQVPKRCVKTKFTIKLKGSNISKATLYVDGRRVKSITPKGGARGSFTLDARDFSSKRSHRITVKIVLPQGLKTLKGKFSVCKRKVQAPKFTG